PDPGVLAALRARQHDVVTVAQLLGAGADRAWIHRQVAAGHWRRLHLGVLVTHSGPVAWASRGRAALLSAGAGAVLSHASAAYLHGWAPAPSRIEVLIPHGRRPRTRTDVTIRRRREAPVVRRVRGLAVTAAPDTVLDLVAGAGGDDDALGWVCAAVRAGTPPGAVVARAASRQRLARRGL
ncbi:hypothetical protein N869_13080, partial [Cellulomonas bogoriensis 69B4 = DSM 16987]